MCEPITEPPYAVPVAARAVGTTTRVLIYCLLLTKVTELRHGVHLSWKGFAYPLRRMVTDPNARVGDHDYALHFGTTPESAERELGSYGSHRLAVLPTAPVWEPVHTAGLHHRCWHAPGCVVLFCYDCAGLAPAAVRDPAFWAALSDRPDSFPQDWRNAVWQLPVPVRAEANRAAGHGS
jgi:hypothetical protein